jgi:oligopeptide transport system permease protein
MTKFFALRVLQFPLILAVIYVTTYLLAWVAPGTPFQRSERQLTEQQLRQLREQYHADNPLQFLAYYPLRMLKGDFGPSFNWPERTVGSIIREALPVSIVLGVIAVALAMVVGVLIGVVAAVWRDGVLDWISLCVALVGVSVPSFVAAALLVSLFAFKLGWFPLGWPGWEARAMILPAISLSLLPMAYVTRLTRVSMIDTLGSDYVRTARAKGLGKPTVIFRHCLRNALLPVLSYLGPASAATLVGSFVIEKVFNIPGLGRWFVEGVANRDQTMILGTVMVYSTFLLGLNLLVDLLYGWVDPRIDVTATSG